MGRRYVNGRHINEGLTLIELLLALFILSLLTSLAFPIVTSGIQRAKESALKEDLYMMRKAIDAHYGDTRAYPPDLETLVEKRYLRRVPIDPFTQNNDSWTFVWSDETNSEKKGIVDVHSGSDALSDEGIAYATW